MTGAGHGTAHDAGPRTRLASTINTLADAVAETTTVAVRVEGCTRCYTDAELDALGADPWTIPDDLVVSFATNVVWHWSQEQYGLLWRRLAPRIVRLAGAGGNHVDLTRLLRGVGSDWAGFPDWPAPQRQALLAVFDALLEVAMTSGWSPDVVLDLLGGLSALHDDDPTLWLGHLLGITGPAADATLVRVACEWTADLLWGYQLHWGDDDAQERLRDWLLSSGVRERVRVFAVRHPGCKTAADALVALDALGADQRSPWFLPSYPPLERLLPTLPHERPSMGL